MKHNLLNPEITNNEVKLIVVDIANIPAPAIAKQALVDMERHGYKLAVVAHYSEDDEVRKTFEDAIDHYKIYHLIEHTDKIIDLVDDRFVRAMKFFKLNAPELLVITDNIEAVKLAKKQSIYVLGYSEDDNPQLTQDLGEAGADKIFYSIESLAELLTDIK